MPFALGNGVLGRGERDGFFALLEVGVLDDAEAGGSDDDAANVAVGAVFELLFFSHVSLS